MRAPSRFWRRAEVDQRQRYRTRTSEATWNARQAPEYLDTTGLYNLRARLYNPTIGQFTTLDPAVDLTGQPYAYANNNPLRYTDPSGLWSCANGDTACDIGQFAVGELLGVVDFSYGLTGPGAIQGVAGAAQACAEGYQAEAAQRMNEANLKACASFFSPAIGITNSLIGTWQSAEDGCMIDAGRQFAPALLTVSTAFAPFAKAAAPSLRAQLQQAATDANSAQTAEATAQGKPVYGPVYGTRAHTRFADLVNQWGASDVHTEVTYLNNAEAAYGTKGGVRLDVVVGPRSAPTAVYDYKTGNATLTAARIAEIRRHLPPASKNIPIEEIRP